MKKQWTSTAKQDYRTEFWATIEHHYEMWPKEVWKRAKTIPERKVLLLDTSKALESKHLINLGYNPDNIHVANYSAGQLAGLNSTLRRAGLPRVHTHAEDIIMTAAIRGPFDVIAYDGCATIEREETQQRIQAMRKLSTGFVGATIYGCRDVLSDTQRRRRLAKALEYDLHPGISPVTIRKYVNNHSPMLWGLSAGE